MMETGSLAFTQDNILRGTPAYIAPEQALGGSAIDSRVDIYAMGCVAYFLLTGQLVFTADTPMAILVHHAHTIPTPPSERSEMPIPRALDELVMACLAKRPGDRPQSSKELSLRLAAVDVEEWTQERARQWWDTHEPAAPPAAEEVRSAKSEVRSK